MFIAQILCNCFSPISLFKRGQLTVTKTLRTFTNGKQSGLSGQITLMSETQWYLQCHYKNHILWLREVQKQTSKKPNQPKADMPVNIFSRIKTNKKGRRWLTRWNSYTLCSADSHSYSKLPISEDNSCGKSPSVFTPTRCVRSYVMRSFQTGKHSGFNINHAVLKLALTTFPHFA